MFLILQQYILMNINHTVIYENLILFMAQYATSMFLSMQLLRLIHRLFESFHSEIKRVFRVGNSVFTGRRAIFLKNCFYFNDRIVF